MKEYKVIYVDEKLIGLESYIEVGECSDKFKFEAYGPGKALLLLENEKVDVVSFLIRSPRLDGLKFLERIVKLRERLNKSFIILVTYTHTMLKEQEVLDKGADAFICGPISDLCLSQRVQDIYKKKQAA